MNLDACLAHVCAYPWDEFMRAHARQLLAGQSPAELRALCAHPEPIVRGLVLETLLLTPAHAPLRHELWPDKHEVQSLAQTSPQLFLRATLVPDHANHALASAALRPTILGHHLIQQDRLPALPDPGPDPSQVDIASLRANLTCDPPCPRRPARKPMLWPWNGSMVWVFLRARKCATRPRFRPGVFYDAGNWTALCAVVRARTVCRAS